MYTEIPRCAQNENERYKQKQMERWMTGLMNSDAYSISGPDLQNMEQIRRIMRPTDVPDTGLL